MAQTYQARPTVYNGVRMRSRLEAGYAKWLDEWHFAWEYEPCAFATDSGQYLPDFRLNEVGVSWDRTPRTAYVEVKPNTLDEGSDEGYEAFDLLMRKMTVIWQSEPDALLLLARPHDGAQRPYVELLRRDHIGGGPFDWFYLYEWVAGPSDTLVLTQPLTARAGPWPPGWWQVS